MTVKLLVVGGGKMGTALLDGLIARKWAAPSELGVVEPAAERRAVLGEGRDGLVVTERPEPGVLAGDGGAVLAVKPEVAEVACRDLGAVGITRLLSIVAGMRIAQLERALGPGRAVVRAMSNTGALVGAAANAIAPGRTAQPADLDWAESVLLAVGTVVRVDEDQIDAVTGLSGSGPAYVFLLAEALADAGEAAGLPLAVSRALTIQTLLGSAKLLAETGEDPQALRAAVTSPGGTTAAGLRVLQARGVRSAFVEAVTAATERSRALGD
jgi:pyrroline-5-carboxylate reductase